MKFELRDYQKRSIIDIKNSFLNGNRSVLYVLPTGGGKTAIMSEIVNLSNLKDKKILILTHRIEILEQTLKNLNKFNLNYGIINSGYYQNIKKNIQIASVQTLIRRLHVFDNFDLIIIDEAHHVNAKSWLTIVNKYHKAYIIGFTATPTRLDGTGLGVKSGGIFEDIIIGKNIQELIDLEYLLKPETYSIGNIDLKNAKISNGEYTNKSLSCIIDDNRSIIGDTIKHYQKIANNRKSVIFCINLKHCEDVCKLFNENGIKSEIISSKIDKIKRKEILNNLKTGKTKVLINCEIISEGFDEPNLECAILLRPTLSLSLHLQQIGRILRPMQGKKTPIILDHVGNIIRHGLAEEVREWSLDGLKKIKRISEKNIAIKICPTCYHVSKNKKQCDECGFVYITNNKINEINYIEGELVKIENEEKKKNKIEVAVARSLQDLKNIERLRGYKYGWAQHVFNARNNKKISV